MSKHRVSSTPRRITYVAACALLLAACGGSGDGKTGAAGTSTGAAGTTGGAGAAGGATAGTPGSAGSTAAGTTGAAGAAGSTGGAGVTGASGTTGQGWRRRLPGAAPPAQPPTPGLAAAGTRRPMPSPARSLWTSTAFTEGMEVPLMYKCAQVPPVGMNISPRRCRGPPAPPARRATPSPSTTSPPPPPTGPSGTSRSTLQALAANVEHVATPPMPAGAKQAMQNLDGFTGVAFSSARAAPRP